MTDIYLRQSRAFSRVAAKFEKKGQYAQAEHYRKVAAVRLRQHYAHVEFLKRFAAGRRVAK